MPISKIELLEDPVQIRKLYEFIRSIPLDYPSYEEWTKKCYKEILLGYKKALVCTLDSQIIGNLIFQPHKKDRSCLELKNGRVDQRYRRRKVFTRLCSLVEDYAIHQGYKKIIADAHIENTEVIETFKKLGFTVESQENLYNSKLEVILVKDLK